MKTDIPAVLLGIAITSIAVHENRTFLSWMQKGVREGCRSGMQRYSSFLI